MTGRYRTISFLSDFGTVDESVGVVKSVIRSIAPDAAVIDITHEVAAHDVKAGSLTLARSAQYLAPGVVLAVVDPGVGTERRAVAVEVGDGESVLVGPDNGLMAPAVAMVGGATRAVELVNADFQLPSPGATFGARDIFGPAAAHLCAGVPLTELGPLIQSRSLQPALLPVARPEDGGLECEVFWVDRFGNAQLNIGPEEVVDWGDRVLLRIGDLERTATVVDAYAEIEVGSLGLVIDSYGLLSVSVDRSSAADELGLAAGDAIHVGPIPDADGGGSDRDRGVTTPVTLRERR
jgi:hypothetical protein